MNDEKRDRRGWRKPRSEPLWGFGERWGGGLQLATGRFGTVAMISTNNYQESIASVLLEDKKWGVPDHVPGRGAVSPSLAVLPDTSLVAVWVALTDNRLRQRVMASVSSVGGKDWGTPVSLSDAEGVYADPQVAVTSLGRVVVAWTFAETEYTYRGWERGTRDVVQSTTLEAGSSEWSRPIDVSDKWGADLTVRLVAGDRDLALSWRQRGASDQCRVSTLASGASTWTTALDPQSRGESVAVAADPNGRIYALWNDRGASGSDLIVSTLDPNGVDWSSVVRTTAGPSIGAYTRVAITPSGHIFVLDSTYNTLDVVDLAPGASSWSSSTRLAEGYRHSEPVIASSPAGPVAVGWEDGTSVWAATHDSRWLSPVCVGEVDETCEGLDLTGTTNALFVLAWTSETRMYVATNRILAR